MPNLSSILPPNNIVTSENEATLTNKTLTDPIIQYVAGDTSFTVPSGTTAERPSSPETGELRFNTDEGSLEQYDGTNWGVVGPVDIGGQTNVTAAGDDELLIEDASDSANVKKVTAQSIADLSVTGVTVEDDASVITSGSTAINFGNNLSVADDGDSTVTVDVSGISPGLELISSATASGDASIDFTNGIDDTYDEYIISLIDVEPESDNGLLRVRTSSNGGSTFDSGSSDYGYTLINNGTEDSGTNSTSFIEVSFFVGSNINEQGVSGEVHIYQPSSIKQTNIRYHVVHETGNGTFESVHGGGARREDSAVNAIRFFFNNGNIESGKIKLYGVKK